MYVWGTLMLGYFVGARYFGFDVAVPKIVQVLNVQKFEIFTDPENGLQYLYNGDTLIPRMGRDGRQMREE